MGVGELGVDDPAAREAVLGRPRYEVKGVSFSIGREEIVEVKDMDGVVREGFGNS